VRECKEFTRPLSAGSVKRVCWWVTKFSSYCDSKKLQQCLLSHFSSNTVSLSLCMLFWIFFLLLLLGFFSWLCYELVAYSRTAGRILNFCCLSFLSPHNKEKAFINLLHLPIQKHPKERKVDINCFLRENPCEYYLCSCDKTLSSSSSIL